EAGRGDAELGGSLAVVLLALGAHVAVAAAPRAVDGDGGADLEPGDALAELVDDAGALVAEGERQPVDVLLLGQAHDERVGVADAGGGDLQTHLAGAGLRGLDLHDLRCGADRAVLQCLHSILLLGRLDVPALIRRISAGSAPGMGRRSRFGGYAWPRCSSTRST